MMGKKILVVDDEKPIADILKFNLEKEGFEIVMAHDGDEAIEKANEEQPDMVLLDIMLPGKDGLEVCREIRKAQKCRLLCLQQRTLRLIKY